MSPSPRLVALFGGVALAASACIGSTGGETRPLIIGGIPDEDQSILEERFNGLADYLSGELDLPVVYQPAVDYTAIVTAFANGDIQLGWFGALTGTQARLESPGAATLAQRPIDQGFVSVFIVGEGVQADDLADLRGKTFTFGSESSTSGHLMPRFYLQEAGIDPAEDFATTSFSGSHDQTWKLVEAGSFDAGSLNVAVWERAIQERQVDTDLVREIGRTPEFTNYHWAAHGEIDERFGEGTTERIRDLLLSMHETPEGQKLLEMFDDERFVPADADDYAPLEQIARDLGLLGE